jgi:hypothetical protein
VNRSGRVAVALTLTLIAAGIVAFAFINLMSQPNTIVFNAESSGVNITLQTVGTYGSGAHPTWVSYLTQAPSGNWEHTTIWQVPAHTRVNLTIYQYDSGSPLRNQQVGQVTGTIGGTATLNGKSFSVINSNANNGVAHTFSIPTLGISVPLYGNSSTASLCSAAPCQLSSPHNVIKFSFMSPGPGTYPWQCFVPCGLGWLYGNGGPMSTLGYMGGFMKVA